MRPAEHYATDPLPPAPTPPPPEPAPAPPEPAPAPEAAPEPAAAAAEGGGEGATAVEHFSRGVALLGREQWREAAAAFDAAAALDPRYEFRYNRAYCCSRIAPLSASAAFLPARPEGTTTVYEVAVADLRAVRAAAPSFSEGAALLDALLQPDVVAAHTAGGPAAATPPASEPAPAPPPPPPAAERRVSPDQKYAAYAGAAPPPRAGGGGGTTTLPPVRPPSGGGAQPSSPGARATHPPGQSLGASGPPASPGAVSVSVDKGGSTGGEGVGAMLAARKSQLRELLDQQKALHAQLRAANQRYDARRAAEEDDWLSRRPASPTAADAAAAPAAGATTLPPIGGRPGSAGRVQVR